MARLVDSPKVVRGHLLAGVLGLLSCGMAFSQAIPPSVLSTGKVPLEVVDRLPEFTLSTDPEEEILKVGHYGRDTTNYREFTLYGDQRLRRTQRVNTPESEFQEVELEYSEVVELVRLAVIVGLVDTNQGDLQQRIRDAEIALSKRHQKPGEPLIHLIPPVDSPRSDFSIRLSSFAGSGATTNRLTLEGLGPLAERFPEIEELNGWLLIGKLVAEHFVE